MIAVIDGPLGCVEALVNHVEGVTTLDTGDDTANTPLMRAAGRGRREVSNSCCGRVQRLMHGIRTVIHH